MNLYIRHCPDARFIPYVDKAIRFYINFLVKKPRLISNIEITVSFNKSIDVFGYTSIVGYNATKKPRNFLIEVHPDIGGAEILKTLAHECVHIKQYIFNETDEMLSHWKGQEVNSDDINYFEHPWEIDAYGREVGVFTKFATEEKLWDVFEGIRWPDILVTREIGWKQ